MKYFYSLLLALCMHFIAFGQTAVTYTVVNNTATAVSPYFDETDQVKFTFVVPEAAMGISATHALYLWGWSVDSAGASADCPTNGSWTASNATNKLTYVSTDASGKGTYTFTMNTVKSFYGNRTNPLAKIGFLLKAFNPTSDAQKSQDINLTVGRFQFKIANPANGVTNFYTPGTAVNLVASATLSAQYQVFINGALVSTSAANAAGYSYPYTVNTDSVVKIVAIPANTSYAPISVSYTLNVTPAVTSAPIPSWIREGINYDPADPTHVGLALYAPNKSYVHVIGDFDADPYVVKNKYLMKRDTANPDLFWIDITGLTSQKVYTFQYRTFSNTNIAVKVADPYSRQILSPDDDPYINSNSNVYPNLPTYPAGQQYDVSVIQTGMPAYNWQVPAFTRPAKEKLIVYELLVRDFTKEGTWASTMARIPYLKTLGINAIELMPVMEFDGNNSWGYNTGFHYALDKAYGTPDQFKTFIDACHQNGIAVILDIALNHATGRSPIERMWTNSLDGSYGDPSSINPYFNTATKHSYGVFNDFNHTSAKTNYYVQRVLEQWISEYKVDGFRWDLTKGFTQSCSAGDDACTNGYLADRVAILQKYADTQWNLDPSSYIIFEHLGTDSEEQQWANYKNGVMMWDKLNTQYNQNTMGYNTSNDFSRADFELHGFAQPRAMNYGESHDEERLNYKNEAYGASGIAGNAVNSVNRMKAYGAVFLTVPGPKMIWQFGELGYDKSIFTCTDGTVNTDSDATAGDCKLDPKPSAFTLGYDADANRQALYNVWSKINTITANNPIFQSKTFTVDNTYLGSLAPRIFIWDGNNVVTQPLKNIVILANFGTSVQNVVPDFPYAGNWYNLMDNSVMNVASVTAPISLAPGDFRIYGNAPANYLATAETAKSDSTFRVTPNPVTNGTAEVIVKNAKNARIYIYDMAGNMVGTQKLTVSTGSETVQMNYPAGLYLVQLKSDNGVVSTKVLVK